MSDVLGFREVVDENGEVTYEFDSSEASDSEVSAEENVEFAPLRLVRRNAIPNLDLADQWENGLNLEAATLESGSDSEGQDWGLPASAAAVAASVSGPIEANPPDNVTPGPSVPSAGSSSIFDVGDSSTDEDYVPPENLYNDDEFVPQEFAETVERARTNRSGRRRNEPRTLRRRRKASAGKKKKLATAKKTTSAVKKELPPLVIRRNVECMGNLSGYKSKPMSDHKVIIPREEDLLSVYNIGSFRLKIDCSTFDFSFNKENITEYFQYPVFIQMSFIKDGNTSSSNTIVFKHEKPVSDEEAASIPRPKVEKYRGRRLTYVDVEHYLFSFNILDDLEPEFFEGLKNKALRLDFDSFNATTGTLQLNIVLHKAAVLGDHTVESMPAALRKQPRNLLCHYFGLTLPDQFDAQEKEDIEWFYGQVEKFHRSENLPEVPFSLQHPSLNPILRDYQRAAVNWMMYKEGCLENDAISSSSALDRVVHNFFEKMAIPVTVTDGSGEEHGLYFNPYIGYISRARPTKSLAPSGGILADEMGLGKTVEVLALILLHPCPDIPAGKSASVDASSKQIEDSNSPDLESEYELSQVSDESDSDYKDDYKGKRSRKPSVRKNRCSSESQVKRRRARDTSPCEFEVNASATVGSSAKSENRDPEKGLEKVEEIASSSSNKNRTASSKKRKTPKAELDVDTGNPPRKSRKKAAKEISGVEENKEDDNPQASAATESSGIEENKVEDNTQASTTEVVSVAKRRPSTYDKLKVLYDAQISEYESASKVQTSRKFHGTFFDTTIRREARFECLCGGGLERRQKSVQCHKCLSSQHASCVNFDMKRGKSSYLCPHCEVSEVPIKCKATLIVTPATISHQWIKEIQRHVKNQHLRILFYKGVSHHGYFPPVKFTEYDLVVTTYNILAADLTYVDLPHTNSEDGRNFRRAKRFMTTPSSLTAVLWWRICLDEAQMVEGISTKMAMMASRLSCCHRWCVTGTPMNKGLQDLYGLLLFLQIEPICYINWWEYLVRMPFRNKDTSSLFEFFGQVMWRTGKRSVLDQLGIPPQIQKFHWLHFSALESHFYKRQFEIVSAKIIAKIARLKQVNGLGILSSRLASLDRQTLHSLLQPFLELRQACCHPQMVKGNVLSLQKLKGTMSMEDILDQLMKKTTLQCIDDHRLVVAAMNGLAGLYMLSSRWPEAAQMYRDVISADENYIGKFRTDSLQLLHALDNLADLLDRSYVGVGCTLNDDQLRPKATEIRNKYLEKYANAVRAARDMVYPVTAIVTDLMEKFECLHESWHASVLRRAVETNKHQDIVWRIKEDLQHKYSIYKKKSKSSIANRFTEVSGLQHVMIEKIQELEEKRDDVLGGLEEMLKGEPSSFVEAAVCCHLRGQTPGYYNERKDAFRCNLCKYHDVFVEYENILFSTEDNTKKARTGRNRLINQFTGDAQSELTAEERAMLLAREEEELMETTEHVNINVLLDQRKQTWGDSDVEKILKILANFGRLNGCSIRVQNDASNHLKIFENMKKEFKLLRILWRQIFDQVSAFDELGQATTRLRIGSADEDTLGPKQKKTPKGLSSGITEKADKIMNIHVVYQHEIDLKIDQFNGDCAMGKQSLAIHMGQLLYLESLKKNGYGKKGSYNSEDCPICACSLGNQWCVLNCGHSFCSDCIKKLGSKNSASTFQCPLCRIPMSMATVSFIDTRAIEDESTQAGDEEPGPSRNLNQKPVEVKGSFSTKVESIVETLLRLQDSHRGEKVLIFSEWTEVLQIIGEALEQNDIQFCELFNASAKKTAHAVIEKFKVREDIQVLLIPIHSGSKGLNLIEATHVFLVEPILNIASELQAIGRVHRIGQTRSTYVHRFYVKKTIEEQLQDILKTQDISSDNEGVLTIGNLQALVSDAQVVQLE